MILSAAAIVALAFTANAESKTIIQQFGSMEVVSEDERTKVELDKLPETVQETLKKDDYKGWAATEAYWVTNAAGLADHYEITLKNDAQQSVVLLLNKEGQKVEKADKK